MKAESNHIYIGREDRLTQWAGIAEDNNRGKDLAEEYESKLVAKIKELIKDYLQLDNVNFLFWNRVIDTSWCCQHPKHPRAG